MTDTYKRPDLLQRVYDIADHYGKDAQIDQALEELAELATALHHLKKKPESEDILDNVHEEMADVYIMIYQLMHLIDPEFKTMGWMEHKVERQIERIKVDYINGEPVIPKNQAKDIIRKYMDDGWVPVKERSPAEYERIGYDKSGNKYMQRLEIAYMTDTIEYVHGYYDGYKWLDKRLNTIENVVAWKIHEPYRPERSEK